jgi:hypothetical protein
MLYICIHTPHNKNRQKELPSTVSLVPLCVGLLGRERASTTSHVPTAVGRVRSPDQGSATTTLFNNLHISPYSNACAWTLSYVLSPSTSSATSQLPPVQLADVAAHIHSEFIVSVVRPHVRSPPRRPCPEHLCRVLLYLRPLRPLPDSTASFVSIQSHCALFPLLLYLPQSSRNFVFLITRPHHTQHGCSSSFHPSYATSFRHI